MEFGDSEGEGWFGNVGVYLKKRDGLVAEEDGEKSV
jgi:hypothetical protein